MRLTIGRRLGIAFAAIVGLIAVMYGFTHWGNGQSQHAEERVTHMTDAAYEVCAKQADHLAWLGDLNSTFLENKESIDVQFDGHKCGLGKWLYGEGAERLAAADPEAGKLIEELKGPHLKLHAAAGDANEAWVQPHPGAH